MDIRYVWDDQQNNIEGLVEAGPNCSGQSTADAGSVDVERTNMLLQVLHNNSQGGISRIILGSALSNEERNAIIGDLPVQYAVDCGHNNHLHIRFKQDEMSRLGSVVVLEQAVFLVGDDFNELPLYFADNFGQPLLPWTRVRFSPDVGEHIVVNSDNEADSTTLHQLRVNYLNASNSAGVGLLRVRCNSQGAEDIVLRDIIEPREFRIPVTCVSPPSQ